MIATVTKDDLESKDAISGKPLVSVITIFLNEERFIREAIESVMAQSYLEWELLLVDDGSIDRSTEIARLYADRYPQKVRYLQHDGHSNLGMSASQNLGISEAGGEYVAFLDADDVWLPEKLQQQVDILNSQPEAGMLYGSTLYWYSWETDRPDVLIEPGVEPNSLVKPPDLLVRLLQQEIPVPCPSDIMVRRQAAIEAGGFEESFRRIFTDQVFYAKLCLRWPVYVSGQSWFKYRKHQDSAVSVVKQSGGMQRARFTYLNWLESYLDDNRISDSRVRRALRIARWKNRYPGLSRLSAHIRYRARIAKEFLRAAGRQTLPAPAARLLRAHGGKRDGQPR